MIPLRAEETKGSRDCSPWISKDSKVHCMNFSALVIPREVSRDLTTAIMEGVQSHRGEGEELPSGAILN